MDVPTAMMNPLTRGLVLVTALAALAGSAPARHGGGPLPGRYLFVFPKEVADPGTLAASLAAQGGGTVAAVFQHALKGCAIEGLTVESASTLARSGAVTSVEEDKDAVLISTQAGAPWNLSRLDQRLRPVDGTYTYSGDGSGVTVYVIDTGVRATHAEFGGRVRTDVDYDFGMNDGDASDPFGHGTNVASVVGGATAGVAKGVTIIPLKLCDDTTTNGSAYNMARAIDWVAGQVKATPHAAVINLSYIVSGGSATVDEAAKGAVQAGIPFCAGAGNDGFRSDINALASHHSPGRVPEVMTIGATDAEDREAAWSCYGMSVDLLAPGVGCRAATNATDTAMLADDVTGAGGFSGTSAACPHVAGAVAIYLQQHPGSTPAQVDAGIKAMATQGWITGMKDPNGTTPNLLLYMGSEFMPPPPPPDGEIDPTPTPTATSLPGATPDPSPMAIDDDDDGKRGIFGSNGCRAGAGPGTLAPLVAALVFLSLRRLRRSRSTSRAFVGLALAACCASANAQSWSEPAGAPMPLQAGATLVATGPDTVFVMVGTDDVANTPTPFYRYTPSAFRWDRMADLPAAFRPEGAMAHPPGTNHIYAYPNSVPNNDLRLFRYSINAIANETADTWSPAGDLPAGAFTGNALAATATHLFYVSWSEPDRNYASGTLVWVDHFFKRDLATGQWTALPTFLYTLKTQRADGGWDSSVNAVPGGLMANPDGGDYLYRLRGPFLNEIDRFQISTNQWNGLAEQPEVRVAYTPGLQAPKDPNYPPGFTHAPEYAAPRALCAGPAGTHTLFVAAGQLPGDTQQGLYSMCRFDIGTGLWTVQDATPIPPGINTLRLATAGADVFMLRRGGTGVTTPAKELWHYSIAEGRFRTQLNQPPDWIGSGGCLAPVGNGKDLYALRGAGSREVYHYSTQTGLWTRKADLPVTRPYVSSGGALACDNNGGLIALTTYSSTTWRYTIATDSWAPMTGGAAFPANMGAGGKLIHVGGGRIFATRGHCPWVIGYRPTFEFYLFQNGTWTPKASPPDGDVFFYGSALAHDPATDTIYAFTATEPYADSFTTRFRSYSIATDTWSNLLAAPPATGSGAALCHPGSGTLIFALPGGGRDTLSAYDTAKGIWTTRPVAPGMVGDVQGPNGGGGALVHPGGGGSQYFALQGSISRSFWCFDTNNSAPMAPAAAALGQFRLNGTDPILNGVTNETGVVLKATPIDPDGDSVRLQIQVRETGQAFSDDTPDAEMSPVVPSGNVAAVTRGGLAKDKSYHWRARAIDNHDRASAWTCYGSNPDLPEEADLRVRDNSAPTIVTLLQRDLASDLILPEGVRIAGGRGMRFQVRGDDIDGDTLQLEVELRAAGEPFRGEATHSGAAARVGWTPEVIAWLVPGSYHWQARVVDTSNAASAWADGSAFELTGAGSKNAPTCLSTAAGSAALLPLLVVLLLRRRAFRG